MRKNKRDTELLSIVDVYKLVLTGGLTRFPSGTWSEVDNLENGSRCIKHMIEEILKWKDEDIKEKLSLKTFKSKLFERSRSRRILSN